MMTRSHTTSARGPTYESIPEENFTEAGPSKEKSIISSDIDVEEVEHRLNKVRAERKKLLKLRELKILEEQVRELRQEPGAKQYRSRNTTASQSPESDNSGPTSREESAAPSRYYRCSDDADLYNNVEDSNPYIQASYRAATKAEQSLRLKDPPDYRGKTLKEHAAFVRACELNFRIKLHTYQAEELRVLYGQQFLCGKVAEQWARLEKENGYGAFNWDQFKDILLNWVQSPANRFLGTAEKYERAEQGSNQDVRAFVLYLQELEDKLPEYTEDQKTQHFVTKIKPEVRRALYVLEHLPKTRDDMIEAAARIEENFDFGRNPLKVDRYTSYLPAKYFRSDERVRAAPGHITRRSDRFRAAPWKSNAQRNSSNYQGNNRRPIFGSAPRQPSSASTTFPNNTPTTGHTPIDKTRARCFNCQAYSHYANECKKPKRGEIRSVREAAKPSGNYRGRN